MPMKRTSALATAWSNSFSLAWTAALSRFWVAWIRNTIRKVTMVVPVLITNCQVSLKPNRGPVTAQMTTMATAIRKVVGLPLTREVATARRANQPPLDCDVEEAFAIGRLARIDDPQSWSARHLEPRSN